MEKLINPTSIEASLKINEIINELENNSIADVTQGDLKNKIIVQKRNGSNSEITIDNVENAKKASRAIADDAGDIIRTSYLKKINGVIQGDLNISGNYKVNGNIFNEALNILKRNKRYALGDIVFDSRLKSHLHLKCVKGGTTDTSDLDTTFLNNVSVGNQFSDGEVTWEAAKFITDSDLKFSVTATDRADQIRVNNNNGREEIITVNNVENALKVNNHTVEENVPRNAKFTDTTYTGATSNRDGLMSKEDKIKLDGIADGANKTVVDSALNSNSVNPVQNKVITNALAGKSPSSHTHNYAGSSSPSGSANTALALTTNGGSAVQPVYFANGKPVACTYKLEKSVPSNAVFTDTTYGVASQTANGLLSASDKKKLDSISSNATHIVVDTSLNASSVNPVQNKAITNAINKCISKNPTVIPREADLNTILETGYYSCAANDTAKTIKNCPIQEAFYLEVVKNQESSNSSQLYTQFKQVLTSYNTNPKTFIRTLVNHSGTVTFGAWQEFVFSQNAIKSITANNNILTYTTANAKTQTVTIDNVPNATHAQSSGKLTTPRSISVGGGAIGTPVNFDGTQNITIPIDSIREAVLEWGGKNHNNSYGCIDSAIISSLGANRLAFGKADGIIVEYSRDGGATWQDYGLDKLQKVSLFGNGAITTVNIGKSAKGQATNKCLVRITIDTDKFGIYTILHKFALYISTSGSQSCYCTIDGSIESTPDNYKVFANKIPISGWSGYNIININDISTYGNTPSTQYGKLRFTFGCEKTSTTYDNLQIIRIMGFGGVGWQTPSPMAKEGHLYNYDNYQNAIFPANVSAKLFDGLATKAQKDSREQVIDSTYIKGLSANGRTITVTKGDGTTSTITTQDTNDKVKNDLNQNTKAYITGTTSGSSNTGTQIFDSNVFLDAAPGVLCATTFRGNLEGHITNLKLRIVSPLTNLSSANNGWFKFTGTIDGVNGNWIIFKADTLYQATNIEDPRIVLNSNNLTTWYSPYAYWHA